MANERLGRANLQAKRKSRVQIDSHNLKFSSVIPVLGAAGAAVAELT